MLTYLSAEGEIACTLIRLNGFERGETRTVSFRSENRIPELRFSRGEIFRFSLRVKEEGEVNPLTQVTKRWRAGELGFFVFLSGVQRATYSGGFDFSLHPIEREQRIRREDIAVNQYPQGRMGTVAIDLSLKIFG